MSKIKVLLLGADTFTGKDLLTVLIHSSFDVTVLSKDQPDLPDDATVKWINGNLSTVSASLITQINPDIVFHFEKIEPKLPFKPFRLYAAWKGKIKNKNLLIFLNKLKKDVRVIYLSSYLMYGPGSHTESSKLNPVSVSAYYSIAEEPLINNRQNQVKVSVIRAPWILGFGSWFKEYYHNPIRKHQMIQSYAPGNHHMMFIDLRDLTQNLIRISGDIHEGVLHMFMPGKVLYKDFLNLLISSYQIKSAKAFDKLEVKKMLDPLVFEVFNHEILLETEFPDQLSNMQFSFDYVMEMLEQRLAAFSKHE
jgi:nucleoside-diphosphate-sugar epimerase